VSKLRIILLFVFLLLFSVSLQAKEQQGALSYINSLRQKSGLIKFKSNKKLNKAAKSHASYLVRQQKHGHYEKKGRKGYTGRTTSGRVFCEGYAS